jgi:hypothetical protein
MPINLPFGSRSSTVMFRSRELDGIVLEVRLAQKPGLVMEVGRI